MAQNRQEADSGLRAGFVNEEDVRKADLASEKIKQKESPKETETEEKEKSEPVAKKKVAKSKPQKASGPKISMQGISGKEITGVVKVVKKTPKKDESEVSSQTEASAAPEKTKIEEPKQDKISEDLAPEKQSPSEKAEVVASGEAKEVSKDEKPKSAEQVSATKQVSQEPSEKISTETKVEAKESKIEKAETKEAKPSKVASKQETKQAKTVATAKKSEPKKTESKKSEVLVDEGVTGSSYKGPRIRPQKGSYVGKNKATPVGSRRPRRQQTDRSQTRTDHRQHTGARQEHGQRSRRPFVQDKDREEAPRRSRSPKQKRQDPKYTPQVSSEFTNNAKVDYRKQHDKRTSGGRDHRDIDYSRRREVRNRNIEQEKLRKSHRKQQQKKKKPVVQLTHVKLPEVLTVRELAELLKKTTADVIAKLMGYGVMATVNQEIDYDTAAVIASDFGIEAEKIVEVTEEDILFDDSEDKEEDLEPRPPVVVVMGHVDHGKTSILDYIRKSRVTAGEAGGITQHIGAYTVNVQDRNITFLDTPGHEAFTTMRARGAQVTDIAILVVAADDGVMPQTIEAINHARAAETEIIVAINKIDKPGINIDRVKQELAQHELLSEDWGGQTTMVEVSALTGENMDELLEMIILTADIMELKANSNRQAKGTVIESKLDRGRGPVATVLIQRGTLEVGDAMVVGSTIGNVRAMTNDRGEQVKSAGPSMPVEILGLPDVPESGDIFYEVTDEKVARSLASRRQAEEREATLSANQRMSLDNLFDQIERGEVKEFNLIIKGDVQGSVEAVKQSLEKLSNDEIDVKVIHGAVGAITESDVRLAEVSNAVIIGFNVRPAAGVQDMADLANVDLRMYRVIYDAINDIESAMKGMLDPKYKEVVLGHAQVRETFHVSGTGTIAGSYVTDGIITRSAQVRIVRDGVVIHEGNISSLRRFKDDVREVRSGYECGIGIENYNDVKINDQIEAFEMQEIER